MIVTENVAILHLPSNPKTALWIPKLILGPKFFWVDQIFSVFRLATQIEFITWRDSSDISHWSYGSMSLTERKTSSTSARVDLNRKVSRNTLTSIEEVQLNRFFPLDGLTEVSKAALLRAKHNVRSFAGFTKSVLLPCNPSQNRGNHYQQQIRAGLTTWFMFPEPMSDKSTTRAITVSLLIVIVGFSISAFLVEGGPVGWGVGLILIAIVVYFEWQLLSMIS